MKRGDDGNDAEIDADIDDDFDDDGSSIARNNVITCERIVVFCVTSSVSVCEGKCAFAIISKCPTKKPKEKKQTNEKTTHRILHARMTQHILAFLEMAKMQRGQLIIHSERFDLWLRDTFLYEMSEKSDGNSKRRKFEECFNKILNTKIFIENQNWNFTL